MFFEIALGLRPRLIWSVTHSRTSPGMISNIRIVWNHGMRWASRQ